MKKNELLVRIDPNGMITTLYDDMLGLQDMGESTCWRASHVTWDDKAQAWQIEVLHPGVEINPGEERLYEQYTQEAGELENKRFKVREDALRAEVEFMNRWLSTDKK